MSCLAKRDEAAVSRETPFALHPAADQTIVITYYNDLCTGRTLDLTTMPIKINADKVARRAEKRMRKSYINIDIILFAPLENCNYL